MRLWLLNRIRWLAESRRSAAETGSQGRHRKGQRRGTRSPERTPPPSAESSLHESLTPAASSARGGSPALRPGAPVGSATTGHRGPGPARPPAMRAGAARARIREAPADAAPAREVATPVAAAPSTRTNWYDAATAPDLTRVARRGAPDARAAELARVGVPRQPGAGRTYWRAGQGLPRAEPHSPDHPLTADGRRNCGSLEEILWRQWDAAAPLPAEIVAAIDRLAELPEQIKEKLANGLDAIFVGPGGVPELDDMTALRGVPLPSGQASWDACAGAYGDRKVVVGSQPSPTPDVMCHEVGHALDDLDSPPGKWQSDSAEFRMLYDQCQPHLASDFHRQPGGLGRKEFFADAFAAIASRQRPALVDMLSGDTRTALRIMLYFNRRYGI